MIAFLSNLLLLYPIAFSLFVALRLAEATTDGHKLTVGVQIVRSTVFVLFAFSVIAIVCRASVLSILWLFLFSVMLVILLIRQSRLNRSAVTMTILGCHNELQIQRAVAYFSEEHRGWLGMRLRKLGRLLANNMPWPGALEAAGFCKGSYERLSARVAGRFGKAANASSVFSEPLRIEIELERLLSRLSLLTWVATFGPIFFMYRLIVLPTLLKMLVEFDVPVPPSLQMLRGGATISLIATGVAGFAMLLFAAALTVWIFPQLTRIWPLRWLSGAFYRCLGFVAFAKVAERVPNLIDACRETASLVPAGHIAQQFRLAAVRLEQGEAPAAALARAGLVNGKRLADFDSILSTTGISWAANQLASAEVERMLSRYSLVIQFLVVAFTLMFAALVALMAFGMIEALTVMIQSLT